MRQRACLVEPGRLLEHFGEHERLEQWAEDRTIPDDSFGRGSQEGSQQAGVEHVQLGCLHEPLEPIAEPGLEAADEKQLLENGHVFLGGLVVEAVLTADLREIRQLTRVVCQHSKEPWHLVEPFHVGDVADIALDDGPHVLAGPCLPAPGLPSPQHLRVSSGEHRVHERVTDHRFGWSDQRARQRLPQERRSSASDFGP